MHNTIIKAAVMGFCAGVRRAINLALKVRADFPDKRIFTLGQLIHNNEALHFLETHNIFAVSIEDIFEHTSDYSDSIIVLCAHGSEIGLLQKLESIFFKVIDGTCPHVVDNQKKAQYYTKDAKMVILVGEKKHQEILSLQTYIAQVSKATIFVLETQEEAETLQVLPSQLPVCIMAQTTIQQAEYEKIVSTVKSKFGKQANDSITVLQTICEATKLRQKALNELANLSDFLVVIGGKNSTNTKKLFESAQILQKRVCLVENETELPDFPCHARIGVTAGASTPDFVIDRVINAIEGKYTKDTY